MSIIPALLPVIKDVTLDAAAASVEITVPAGYEILFLEWSGVYGDQVATKNIYLRFNGDTGNNYDYSMQPFGTVSSTANAGTVIIGGQFSNTTLGYYNSAKLLIFNRASQEKVVIGNNVITIASAEDLTGWHNEAKWRNTSDEISTILIFASGGNFTAGSRFILRGLRTSGAPALGSQDIVQFIGSVDAIGASVTLPTIPAGYGMLWLFLHDVYSDHNDWSYGGMTFNGDSGGGSNNYDDVLYSAFGSASSTSNGTDFIITSLNGDVDASKTHGAGFVTIFNRAAQEKVVIGTLVSYREATATSNAHDLSGYHKEAKWRNTSDEINSIVITPVVGNFAGSGKIWLFGVKVP